jgi:tetratricopeptide (TPR) repeat protein
MTHASASKSSLALASIFLFLAATPPSWAQADQWEKHMKAGRKEYAEGMNEKYIHAWGNTGPYPHFTKAEEEFLAALSQAQTFLAGDLRIATTLGELADAYSEEGKFAEAENRANQALAITEASLQPGDPRLGYALIGVATIYDCEDKAEQAAPFWNWSLTILEKAGGIDPNATNELCGKQP